MSQLFKTYAYPQTNYDFDYKTYVDMRYNMDAQGVSDRPTISAFKKDVRALVNYSDALMLKSVPDKNTVAGWSDIDPNNTEAVQKARQNMLQEPPYSRFRFEYPANLYPTNGEYSGSYFVQSGFCPVKSATTREECEGRDPNYNWIESPVKLPGNTGQFFSKATKEKAMNPANGACYKPRYSYVNNANDSGVLKGMLPGFAMEVGDLNPGSFMKTMKGEAVMGYTDTAPPRFQLLPCVAEHFTSDIEGESSTWFSLVLIVVLLTLLWIAYKFN